MSRVIARLVRVKENKPDYTSVTRIHIGELFEITKAKINESGEFEKIDSYTTLCTSKIKDIDITYNLIVINTENTKFYFEII